MTGKPITHYNSNKYDAAFKLKICSLASNAMLKMVFVDNFTHGDLHPGNILVHMTETGPKVIFLDCGIVTDVSILLPISNTVPDASAMLIGVSCRRKTNTRCS